MTEEKQKRIESLFSTGGGFSFWKTARRIAISAVVLAVMALSAFAYHRTIIDEFERALSLQSQNTTLYFDDGEPLAVIKGVENRQYVRLEEISVNIPKAVLAIEDARFFKHRGFDPIRMAKAFLTLLDPHAEAQGASTITQQLAKLTLYSNERTFSRKFRELLAAVSLEAHYSKEKILEFYLNRIYLGGGNYGIHSATRDYFGKEPSQVDAGEAAMLAGMIKKPEGYSPFSGTGKISKRVVIALSKMRQLGWINEEQYLEASKKKVRVFSYGNRQTNPAPHFTNHVMLYLRGKYGREKLEGGGLRVHTTLRREHQLSMQKAIEARKGNGASFSEMAGLSLEPETGSVTAMVGGVDFRKSEFNRSTQAKRQPGSTLKPFLYAAALTEGKEIDDIYYDEPYEYLGGDGEFYQPQNFNREHLGPISLADALTYSNNVVSVRILDDIGIDSFVRTAAKFGFSLPSDKGFCLALGCSETTLLELTKAYSAFANGGILHEPRFIKKIVDGEGKVLEASKPNEGFRALEKEHNATMNRMLSNVVENGTGRNAYVEGIVGGKTGTTDDFRDAWFVGYTDDLVAGFWIGNDDNSPTDGETGGKVPAGIWKDYVRSLR